MPPPKIAENSRAIATPAYRYLEPNSSAYMADCAAMPPSTAKVKPTAYTRAISQTLPVLLSQNAGKENRKRKARMKTFTGLRPQRSVARPAISAAGMAKRPPMASICGMSALSMLTTEIRNVPRNAW
ncbi:hypothetical protein D9M72_620620 [compost metagenome]